MLLRIYLSDAFPSGKKNKWSPKSINDMYSKGIAKLEWNRKTIIFYGNLENKMSDLARCFPSFSWKKFLTPLSKELDSLEN